MLIQSELVFSNEVSVAAAAARGLRGIIRFTINSKVLLVPPWCLCRDARDYSTLAKKAFFLIIYSIVGGSGVNWQLRRVLIAS